MMILLGLGCLLTVASCVAALRARSVSTRLHYLSPVTSLGGPLIGMALALANGWSLTTALVLLIVVLLAVTGPVLGAATGRSAAQRDGVVSTEPSS